MTLETKLRWKAHVKIKREELGIRYKCMYWLIGRNSPQGQVDMVDTVFKKFAVSHEHRLHQQVYMEAYQLLDTTDNISRLKRISTS